MAPFYSYQTQQIVKMSCLPLPISHSDPSLTSQNVHQVMEVVRKECWRDVGKGLSVQRAILDKINAKCSSDDEKMSAVIKYVVTIIPDITWEKIATELYKGDEEKAVERVKPYLNILPGGFCFNPQHIVTYCPALSSSDRNSINMHRYKQLGSLPSLLEVQLVYQARPFLPTSKMRARVNCAHGF